MSVTLSDSCEDVAVIQLSVNSVRIYYEMSQVVCESAVQLSRELAGMWL